MSESIVTKLVFEINFMVFARLAEVVELGFELTCTASSSVWLGALVLNKMNSLAIAWIDKMVFVHVNDQG